jgi:DNA topoisomerase-2
MSTENPVSKFFASDYIAFASYDGVRKIASFVDGLKPTARKVVYTALDLNIVKPDKVDLIKAKVAGHTEYLHGQDAIEGVIVNLAQNFVGACNVPLMSREGSFGFRLIPNAAASRYIKSCQEPHLKSLFRPEDDAIIGNQEFEGSTIEPKYYVPIIPMLLVNGSEGIAVGYAQRILPRDPKKLMDYIFGGMKDESLLIPSFNGFKGKVVQTDEKSFAMYGCMECKNTTTYEITEVPIGYTYGSYMKVLNKLSDSGFIQSFDDFCDMDKDVFKFTVKVRRDTHKKLSDMTHDEQLEAFKLVKRVTENYTVLNENNQIEVFDNVKDILKRYAQIRIETYDARKKHIEAQMLADIRKLKSKIIFIEAVRNETIDIKSTPKHELIEMFENSDEYVEHNGSYDYLLNMPIWSINEESQQKAIAEAKKLGEEYKKYCSKKISTIWKQEYAELCKKLT